MKKTLQNLIKAFIGESQARNRYDFYAKVAQKEGYEQIGGVFTETAEQEKTHAKRLFEHIQELKGDKNEIEVPVLASVIYGKTAENLKAAIKGERWEYKKMYPEFAKVAEKHHEERYKKLLKKIKNKTVFKKTKKIWWVCRECGYVHFGKMPPAVCPSCDHARAFYQVKSERY